MAMSETEGATATAVKGPDAKVAVRLENLSKTYPGTTVPAVDNLTLDIADGEVFTLLGPSGCGKTTTLRMVAGLEVPDTGQIYFGDREIVITDRGHRVPPEKRNIGMVFQSYAIWPHMTVEQNVSFPLKTRHMGRAEIKDRVANVLELVGMAGGADETPLNGKVGPHRRFDWIDQPLDELKEIRRAWGCTINDVVLTIVTGAVLFGLGLFGLGGIVRYVPFPVIGGFRAGVGWLLLVAVPWRA